MGKASAETTVDAPPAVVFAYLDDYRNTPKYMAGLKKWEPAGDKTHGEGAMFLGAMDAAGQTLESTLEITTWRQDEAIGWTPRDGFKQGGQWTLTPEGDGTRVSLAVEFSFPGGFAGKAVAKMAEPVVKNNVRQSVAKLKSQVEELHS